MEEFFYYVTVVDVGTKNTKKGKFGCKYMLYILNTEIFRALDFCNRYTAR